MLNVLAVVGSILLAALVGLVIFASTRPDVFRIERSTQINAPANEIYGYLIDFRRWNAWSPYETKDPAMKRVFSGPARGKGAAYAFQGNDQVGSGELTILETHRASEVRVRLDMLKPMKASNEIIFSLEPHGAATRVTWAMEGDHHSLLGKVAGVILNLDKMVGGDFETGLRRLKTVAEG